MSAIPIPPLPLETIEGIVDFLYDDRPTLFACSLASSKFVSVSRHHLFSEVTFASTKFHRFLELLNAPWSSIANRVSRLVITGDFSWKTMTCQMRLARRKALRTAGDPGLKCLPADLSRIRARIQSVKSVRFSDLSPTDIPASFWSLLAAMKGVKSVEAHRIGFQCPLPFLEFVSSLPLLETLAISRPTITMPASRLSIVQKRICEGGGEGVSILLPQRRQCEIGTASLELPLLDLRRTSQIPVQDQNLDISTIAGIAVLEWLMAQNPRPFVKALRINLDYERDMIELLSRYFVIAGSNIHKLCVALPSSLAALQNMPAIDFSPLTQVEHLHVEGLYISHATNEHLLGTFFRQFFIQLFSLPDTLSSSSLLAMTYGSEAIPPPIPSPPLISKITITLTMDAKSELSFYGLPDHAVLQNFGWFSLPDIIEKSLESFPQTLDKLDVQLRVRSTGIGANEVGFAEELVRGGVWKGFEESGRLQVGFLPMPDRDGDKYDLP